MDSLKVLYIIHWCPRREFFSLSALPNLTSQIQGAGSWRTTFVDSGIHGSDTIWTAVQPNGITNVTAYLTSVFSLSPSSSNLNLSSNCFPDISTNASTISQCYSTKAPASCRISATKYLGITSSDAFPGTESTWNRLPLFTQYDMQIIKDTMRYSNHIPRLGMGFGRTVI